MHLRIINNSQFNTIKKDGSITVNDITIPADNQYIYGVVDDPNEVIVLEDYYKGDDGGRNRFPDTLSLDLIEKVILTADDGKGYTLPCFYKYLARDDYNIGCVPLTIYYDTVNGYWTIEFAYYGDFYWSDTSSENRLSNGRLKVYKRSTPLTNLYNHVVYFEVTIDHIPDEQINEATAFCVLSFVSNNSNPVYSYSDLYNRYLHSYSGDVVLSKLLDEVIVIGDAGPLDIMSTGKIIPTTDTLFNLNIFYINDAGYYFYVNTILDAFKSVHDVVTLIN